MKILFANNYYYLRGGSERVMFGEIDLLKQRGHQVVPFARAHADNPETDYDAFFLPVLDFETMGGFDRARAALNVIYSSPTKKKFSALLDQEKPTLVHGHNIYSGLTYSIVDAAKSRGIPFVLTLHDLKLACPSYLMLNRGEICERCGTGRFWSCAATRCHKESLAASVVNTVEACFNKLFGKYDWISHFICPSRFLLEKISHVGIPREKLIYLPNALDPQAYEPDFESGGYALFAGRLSKEKGVMTLLEAFKGLNIPLRIAGTGPLEQECRKFADAEGMRHVQFEGYCQGNKLKELFRGAALMIIPSECYENAPMTILESYAYGKPVIGGNLGGIPELILAGETGFLFEAGNIDDLRAKVISFWTTPELARQCGRDARRLIETEFSATIHLERLIEVYTRARQAKN